ncbi:hypothetical protein LV457_12500 [Mycobacterium sp. MYCO198283]|uniref:hypothetical protein n=1 Tax=Mycobacterium sp. MYCO198283 TaxID=2883505 RepID=UPI001E5BEB4A|nr:hypothetical protein [Mycobacterium sp. MYCO198283]MCG5433097.1 hypothetical protein [Mycobacterium sp. MYCO198283]
MATGDDDAPLPPDVLAALRADLAVLRDSPAPEVPPVVTERVLAALRSAATPRRTSRAAAVVGAVAAGAVVVVGGVALARDTGTADPAPVRPAHLMAEPTVPLDAGQLSALLRRPPDFGALTEPGRRAACLRHLGYGPGTPPLGAQPVEIAGGPAVLLLLPGDTPRELAALVVRPNCSAADTGLVAQTRVRRP